MAESAGNIKIGVNVDFSGLKQQLKRAESASSKSVAKMKAMFSSLAMHAKRALIGIGAVITATTLISIKAAMKQEDALFSLQAALSNTGDASISAMKDFKMFAAEIQQVTIFGDEEVLALIALQKNLGVATKDLKLAAEMTIGLSAATGRGAETMATYVAMALQGETTMLRRYIPALRAATSKTEELAIIMKFASNGFKVAQAAAETTSGKLKQMKNAFGDLLEVIGGPFLNAILEASEKLKTFFEDNAKRAEKWATAFAASVTKIVKGAGTLIEKMGGLESVFKVVKIAISAIVAILTLQFLVTIGNTIKSILVFITTLGASTFAWGVEGIAIQKNTALLIANRLARGKKVSGAVFDTAILGLPKAAGAGLASKAGGAIAGVAGGITATGVGLTVAALAALAGAAVLLSDRFAEIVANTGFGRAVGGFDISRTTKGPTMSLAGTISRTVNEKKNEDRLIKERKKERLSGFLINELSDKERIEGFEAEQRFKDRADKAEKQGKKMTVFARKQLEAVNKIQQEATERLAKIRKRNDELREVAMAKFEKKRITWLSSRIALGIKADNESLKLQEEKLNEQKILIGSARSEGSKLFGGVTSAGAAVAISGNELFGGHGGLSADANATIREIRLLRETVEKQTREKNRLDNIDTGASESVTPGSEF